MFLCWRRLARVTVLHGCLGCRTFELPPSADVGDVKARIDAEAGFPAARQRLWHCGREVREGRNSRCRHVGEGDERMTLCCGKHRREVPGSALLGELHPCCLEEGWGGQAGNWASVWHRNAQSRVIIAVLLKERPLLRALNFETNYPCSTYFIF